MMVTISAVVLHDLHIVIDGFPTQELHPTTPQFLQQTIKPDTLPQFLHGFDADRLIILTSPPQEILGPRPEISRWTFFCLT